MQQLVYMPGVWDLLHIGHLNILQKAKALGDVLIVGVASDKIVCEDKGKNPIISETDRVQMLQSLSCVDVALIYNRLEFITHLNVINPTILAVGSTWGKQYRHTQAETWIKTHNCRLVKLPYTERESTTLIRERIKNE